MDDGTPDRAPRRIAIVTGASSGIGRASAHCLARAGFAVVLAARRAAELEALAGKITAAGGRALGVPTDLCDESGTRGLIARTLEAFGRVDLLVNNAGFSTSAALEQLSRAQLRQIFETNLFGALQLIGELTPQMRAQGGGRIVNVSSLAGRVPAPLAVPYAATKGALESATECLRLELGQWGIELALVIPGFVKTPVFDKAKQWGKWLREDAENPYRKLMFDLEAFAYGQLENAIEPEVVGEVVVEAATAARPRARYYVPFSARVQSTVMRSMPARLREQILARVYKLPG